jgi:hypothetical protein
MVDLQAETHVYKDPSSYANYLAEKGMIWDRYERFFNQTDYLSAESAPPDLRTIIESNGAPSPMTTMVFPISVSPRPTSVTYDGFHDSRLRLTGNYRS